MFLRWIAACLLPLATMWVFALWSTPAVHAASLPHSEALDSDLRKLRDQTNRLESQLLDADRAAKRFQDGSEVSRKTAKALRDLDRRLHRLSDRLTPYQSLPHIRTAARYMKKNLDRVRTQVAKARKRSDQVERDVLVPAERRFRDFRHAVVASRSKLKSIRDEIDRYRSTLSMVGGHARQDARSVYALEMLAMNCRPAVQRLTDALDRTGDQSQKVADTLAGFDSLFAAYATVEYSVRKGGEKMRSAETVVGNIDQVISKRIEIKNPINKKVVGFSVREILEKPQDVAKIITKPINKMVDRLLDPILEKMKLEVPAPKGIEALHLKFDQADWWGRTLQVRLSDLQNDLTRQWSAASQTVSQQMAQFSTVVARSTVQPEPIRVHPQPSQPRPKPILGENDRVKSRPQPIRDQPAMFLSF